METGTDFFFLDSEITADSDHSPQIKRYLLFRRKAMTNLDSMFKSRAITLLTNVHIVKAMFFPVIKYGCEGWIIRLSAEELRLFNYGAEESESL